MMMFTAWIATALVALVVGTPILLMFYGLLFNKKYAARDAQTAKPKREARRR